MKKILLFIIYPLIQGALMAATLEKVTINGVDVPLIYEKDTTFPLISMQVIFQNSGSISDGKNPGLAKLTSMILNEGEKKMGGSKFAKLLDDNAIELHASSATESFILELSSLKEQHSRGIELLSLMLGNPNLTPNAFSKVKTLALGHIAQKYTDLDDTASAHLNTLLFPKTILAQPNRGTTKSIEAMTLSTIATFIDEMIVLKRAVIVVGGDISLEEAKKSATIALGSLKEGQSISTPYFTPSSQQNYSVIKRKTDQAYIYFGAPFNLKAGDEKSHVAKVASFILGSSGFGSRMMEEVRVKRGLAYSAYAKFNQVRSHSILTGHLQTKLDKQDEAIKVVKEVIDQFVTTGATQKELDGAKNFLLGSEPLRNETLASRLSRSYGEFYLGLPFGSTVTDLDKINKLTLDELNHFIISHPEIKDLSVAVVAN